MQPEKTKRKTVEEEESSEEEGEVNYTKAGFVEMRHRKIWKPVYCVLCGGSFYFYKNVNEEPKGRIDLQGCKIVTPVKNEKKKNTFAVQKGEELLFVGSCSGGPELEQWTKALQDSLEKEKTDPPVMGKKKKKAGLVQWAKSNVASSVTSVLTKNKVVNKFIQNEETLVLLTTLKKVVKTESGSVKKGDDLERNLIKITVKAYLLIENGYVPADKFLQADKLVREAFELLVRVYNGHRDERVKSEKITEALKKVEGILKSVEDILTQLFGPHLSSKNMVRLSAIFSCIAEAKFFETILNDPTQEADLEKLVSHMEKYTQFHHH